jgi:hypothetical protein
MYAVLGMLLFGAGYSDWNNYQISEQRTKVVAAKIDNVNVVKKRFVPFYRKIIYSIEYSFEVNGQAYKSFGIIDTGYLNFLTPDTEPSGTAQVYYNPENPQENQIQKRSIPLMAIIVFFPGGVFMFICSSCEFYSVIESLKLKFRK